MTCVVAATGRGTIGDGVVVATAVGGGAAVGGIARSAMSAAFSASVITVERSSLLRALPKRVVASVKIDVACVYCGDAVARRCCALASFCRAPARADDARWRCAGSICGTTGAVVVTGGG